MCEPDGSCCPTWQQMRRHLLVAPTLKSYRSTFDQEWNIGVLSCTVYTMTVSDTEASPQIVWLVRRDLQWEKNTHTHPRSTGQRWKNHEIFLLDWKYQHLPPITRLSVGIVHFCKPGIMFKIHFSLRFSRDNAVLKNPKTNNNNNNNVICVMFVGRSALEHWSPARQLFFLLKFDCVLWRRYWCITVAPLIQRLRTKTGGIVR